MLWPYLQDGKLRLGAAQVWGQSHRQASGLTVYKAGLCSPHEGLCLTPILYQEVQDLGVSAITWAPGHTKLGLNLVSDPNSWLLAPPPTAGLRRGWTP